MNTESKLLKEKLLDCPFCGESPTLFFGLDRRTTGHGESGDKVGVICRCGISITEGSYAGYQNEERARRTIDKWNHRV
jgi:hypothetical protein